MAVHHRGGQIFHGENLMRHLNVSAINKQRGAVISVSTIPLYLLLLNIQLISPGGANMHPELARGSFDRYVSMLKVSQSAYPFVQGSQL